MTEDAVLRVHGVARRGTHQTTVDLSVGAGETVAVVGPNGAGKTTLLRAIAGLETMTSGGVAIDGHPPRAGTVGVVFQDIRLLPHLRVVDNVAYPLRAAGRSRSEARRVAEAELSRLGLEPLADRRPRQLSGGQAQRVAIARALVARPRVLLLDEPFAALDAAARPRARQEVADVLRRFDGAAVLVTHDPTDALVLADRVVVLEHGQVTQAGRVVDIARRPATDYAARLVGTNLWKGTATGTTLTVAGAAVSVQAAEPIVDGPARAVINPTAVSLHAAAPGGSPRNVWRGTVAEIEPVGSRARVTIDLGGTALVAEVTFGAVAELGLAPGVDVHAAVKATEVDLVADASPVGASPA